MEKLNPKTLRTLLENYIADADHPTRSGFAKTYQTIYKAALADPAGPVLLDMLLPKHVTKWTPDKVRQLVRDNKLTHRSALARFKQSAYNYANTVPGLMAEIFPNWGAPRRPHVRALYARGLGPHADLAAEAATRALEDPKAPTPTPATVAAAKAAKRLSELPKRGEAPQDQPTAPRYDWE